MEPENASESKGPVITDDSAIMAGDEADRAADYANCELCAL